VHGGAKAGHRVRSGGKDVVRFTHAAKVRLQDGAMAIFM
jgi:hypothetical protein